MKRLRSWWLNLIYRLALWEEKNEEKIRKYRVAIRVGAIVYVVVIVFTFAVLIYGWDWTGFGKEETKTTTTMVFPGTPAVTPTAIPGITVATETQPAKTLWDWLGLLAVLAIPVVVGIGAAWFAAQQGKVSDRENTDNQREIALQAYIDKISELLLKEHLGKPIEEHLGELTEEHLDELIADGQLEPKYKQVRNVARVRTITILTQLNGRRIGYVFAFLREAGLMSTTKDNVVSLRDADLSAVNWSQANLSDADLSKALQLHLFVDSVLSSQLEVRRRS